MRLKQVLRCCVLAGLVVLPMSSGAVGMGRLTLQSGLGQQLSAEIELTSIQPGELDTLSAKLADQVTYGRNKIEYSGALTRIRIALEPRGGRPVLKVSSTQPVNEPFLDLLIELTWASGRIVREYTFLLDPPGYAATTAVDPAPAIASESLAPPVVGTPAARPAPAPAPAPAVAPAPAPAPAPSGSSAGTAPAPSTAASPAAPPAQRPSSAASAASAAAAADQYGPIRRGETLAKIAAKIKPEGVTLEQMLSALYRANAQAFEGKNMNRLRTGPMLTVPKAEEVSALPQPEARREIRVQAADWRAYRERLAASLGTVDAAPATRQSSGGRITTAVDEKSAPAPGSDRLKLSKGEPVTGTIAGAPLTAAAKAENAVASQKAASEANARVADLERQLKNMQRLLELKQPGMVGQQTAAERARISAEQTKIAAEQAKAAAKGSPSSAGTSSSSSAPSMATAPAGPAATGATTAVRPPASGAPGTPASGSTPPAPGATATQTVAPLVTPTPSTATSPTTGAAGTAAKSDTTKADASKSDSSKAPTIAAVDPQKTAPAVTTTPPAGTAIPATPPGSTTQAPAPTSASSSTPTPAPGATGAAQPVKAPDAVKTKPALQPPPPQAESSWLDDLLGNSLMLVLIGSALLLALLYAFLARRRRAATTKFEDSIGAATDLRTSTVFGNTGGGVVNTGDNSLVSGFSREGMGNIDTGEVDPIAEAEVYLAYGRDNQAEEILRDALTKTPERQEIRLKLLEIYAQQNKTAAFEATASEIFNATHGNGEIWTKAAQLGRTIDPDNPLYTPKGDAPDSGPASGLHTLSSNRNDRLSDSNLRVAAAVEKSAAETGFDFTDEGPKKEVFVMPPALTPAEAARASGTSTPSWQSTQPSHQFTTHTENTVKPEPSLGAGTFAAPIAAAAAASVAAAAASRASAVRDRAPLDFKLDSGPEESADAAPHTMDFVTLDGPITLTGATTLSGPSTLSGVTLASPNSDIWGEKPQPTLTEKITEDVRRAEAPIERKDPARPAMAAMPSMPSLPAMPAMVEELAMVGGPETVSPASKRAGGDLGAAHSPQPAGKLDLDKLDLTFDPDRKPFEDPTPSVLDGQWHDAATKLDLAKAYHEMGDVDGAREILQEVVQEGDDQQKKEAQTFLSKLRA